jgi:hypothetical protein
VEYVRTQINKIVNKLGKATCLILLGLFVFVIGLGLYMSRPQVIYTETGDVYSSVMSEDEAKSLIDSFVGTLIKIYEKPAEIFKTEDASKKEEPKEGETAPTDDGSNQEIVDGLLIKDYDTVMPNYFTKDGISQFENMKFKNVSYINKKESKVYFMNNVIPQENMFSNDSYSITKINVKEEEISCNINFSRLMINNLDEVSYEVYTKKLVLVKKASEDEKDNNKESVWLINYFDYANKV